MIIGVDTSGKMSQPPLIVAIVRNNEKITVKFTKSWISQVKKLKLNKEVVFSRILVYVIKELYRKYDMIEIDKDYSDKTLMKIRKYMSTFMGIPKEHISFGSRRTSGYIKKAHVLSQLAKENKVKIDEINPDIKL